ncbi:MAG: hypothetical protein QF599_14360, partial [Planctomycetota bacterium]|nr:hypothetical protein [Planctomycetota bacterium]
MDRPRLEFVFPAAHNPGREARQRIGDFVRHRGFTERDVQTVELVASELICNAIDHGGGGGANEVEELKEQVEVTVSL